MRVTIYCNKYTISTVDRYFKGVIYFIFDKRLRKMKTGKENTGHFHLISKRNGSRNFKILPRLSILFENILKLCLLF